MASAVDICSSFIQGAPPGELNEVVNDIKALTADDEPAIIEKLKPAFQKYNEEQLLSVKLPGSNQNVLISTHNRLSPTTYLSTPTSSFTFDHLTQTASSPSSASASASTSTSEHTTLITALSDSLATHFSEHYPPTSTSGFTVCTSTSSPPHIALLLSTTKSSPANFLSGRWRSEFLLDPATNTLSGVIRINVHYYEDGNVALSTTKTVPETDVSGGNAEAIVKKIAAIEKQYQEEVNRAFVGMNEGSFRGLRRQLPVTRMRVEWEKVRGYGLGGDLRGEARR